MKQGPNVKKLIAHKMSLIMIPPGSKNGLATGIAALRKPGNIFAVCREATAWVEAALSAVKSAPGGMVYTDDEQIAGIILDGIAVKLEERKSRKGTGT